jgi:hypothetical protein
MEKGKKKAFIFTSVLAIVFASLYFFNQSGSTQNYYKYVERKDKTKSNYKLNEDLNKSKLIKREIAAKQEDLIQSTKSDTKRIRLKKSLNHHNLKYKMKGKLAATAFSKMVLNSKVISSNESKYILAEELYAIKKSKINDPSSLNILEEKLGYYIMESDSGIEDDAIRILQNQETNTYAIFTGILKVKLKDLKDIDSIFGDTSYEIKSTYDDINVVMYKFYNFEETMEAFDSLNSTPKVNSKIHRVTIELLEYERTHK